MNSQLVDIQRIAWDKLELTIRTIYLEISWLRLRLKSVKLISVGFSSMIYQVTAILVGGVTQNTPILGQAGHEAEFFDEFIFFMFVLSCMFQHQRLRDKFSRAIWAAIFQGFFQDFFCQELLLLFGCVNSVLVFRDIFNLDITKFASGSIFRPGRSCCFGF